MNRKDEDRILHGLHYYRESIDEVFAVTSDQILWLAAHSYRDGVEWCRDGELQCLDIAAVPCELRDKLLMSKFEMPLRYLQHRRLIELTPTGHNTADIAVTFAGADRAMHLHTRTGRVEVWYQEHKDGFLGIVTTISVSFITALLAVAVSERLHKSAAEPPRIIYEAGPKSQP